MKEKKCSHIECALTVSHFERNVYVCCAVAVLDALRLEWERCIQKIPIEENYLFYVFKKN